MPSGTTQADVVSMARNYLGIPYVFGSTNPKRGLDCSSLVQLVYKNLGIKLPRLVRDQRFQGHAVAGLKNAQPGDLLVFNGYQHIGIYIGNGQMIAAPQPGEKVKIQKVYATPTSIRRVVTEAGSVNGGSTMPAPKLDMDTLAMRYGYSVAFFKGSNELWRLVHAATRGQWTAEEFGARLRNTNWYKKSSSTTREWYALTKTDPATANERRSQLRTALTQQAQRLGVAIDSKRMGAIVESALAHQWNEQQTAAALAGEMHYRPNSPFTGDTGVVESEIKEMAANYGLTLDQKTIFNLIQQQVGGRISDEGIHEYVRKMAKAKYPGLADDIDKGLTVADYASPYIQEQARLLELDPADVHLNDPMIAKALQYRDPKTGAPGAPMSVFDFSTAVKNDSRWLKTKNGRDDLMTGAGQVLKDWGISG